MRPLLRRPSSVSTATTAIQALDKRPKSLLQSRFSALAHDRRQKMVQAQGGGRVLTRGLGDCTPSTTTCTIVVRLHTAPHSSLQLLDSSHCDELHDRSKSTSPIGPPDVSVDAPTIPKCRSEPPKIRPFSPSERQPLPTFSPHWEQWNSRARSPHNRVHISDQQSNGQIIQVRVTVW